MDSIKIDSGIKRIAVNDDPDRVIVFNPSDIQFAERYYDLTRDFEIKLAEYEKRAEVIDQVTEVDTIGLPVNMADRIAFMRDICEYVYGQIDRLFGAGTSQKAFDGTLGLDMIQQFFEGITPFVQQARQAKVGKYLPKKRAGKGKPRRVMT